MTDDQPYSVIGDDHFKTSFVRSHYYENVVDHPFNHLRVTRKTRQDLKIQDPVMLDLNSTVYEKTYGMQHWDGCRSSDNHRRASIVSGPTLKTMHEKFMKDPAMPLTTGRTTTGKSYVIPKGIRTPLKSPVDDSTCPVRALGRDEFPPISPNEVSFCKHLDPYVSTSQMSHTRFTTDQQNGVSRKDVITFYDHSGTPKVRGFGPKIMSDIGPYFHRDKAVLDLVRLRQPCRVPYSGKTSEYRMRYDHKPTNLMFWEPYPEILLPPVFQTSDVLTVPAMYCTEYCHTGTGWPSRAVVNIGRTQGTF